MHTIVCFTYILNSLLFFRGESLSEKALLSFATRPLSALRKLNQESSVALSRLQEEVRTVCHAYHLPSVQLMMYIFSGLLFYIYFQRTCLFYNFILCVLNNYSTQYYVNGSVRQVTLLKMNKSDEWNQQYPVTFISNCRLAMLFYKRPTKNLEARHFLTSFLANFEQLYSISFPFSIFCQNISCLIRRQFIFKL